MKFGLSLRVLFMMVMPMLDIVELGCPVCGCSLRFVVLLFVFGSIRSTNLKVFCFCQHCHLFYADNRLSS